MIDNPIDSTGRIERVLDMFYHVQRIVRSTWPRSWFQFNLTGGTLRALLAIEANEATTPARIAEAMNINRTTMTGILDRLEADGLITRTLDPDDRRSFIIALTQAGHAIIQHMDSLKRENLDNALHTMRPEDVQALLTGMEALVQAMNKPEQDN